jgi:periplasmic copper chaperone A
VTRAGFSGALGALLLLALCGAGQAGEVTTLGPIEIDTPWARASVGTSRPSAAYLTLRNTGERPDRLLGVATPAAAQAEVHAMVHEGGTMRMRPAGPVEIPSGGEAALEPGGGLHIMLVDLRRPLREGERVPLTLTFEAAGAVTVEAPIAGIAARTPPE